MMNQSSPQGPASDDAAQPDDDVKARFKQALEAKSARHRTDRLHPDGDSALRDTHGRSGGKRQFRRKSG